MPSILSRTFAILNNIKPPPNPELTSSTLHPPTPNLPPPPARTKPDVSIWQAAQTGNLSALQYYIHHHTSSIPLPTLLNTRDPDTDCTLLHLAISARPPHIHDLLQLLLENGADASARNIYNVQPIHMASLHLPRPLKNLELLLDHKASPNARDGDGWTPLHYAARFCNPPDEALRLLVSRGADVNLTDASHKTPIFALLANGDLDDCLQWMVEEAKADVSVRGDFLDNLTKKTRPGSVVLQAAKYSRVACLQVLVRSQVAMQQLRRVVNEEELTQAKALVKAASEQSDESVLVLQLLQELEDRLLQDPLSLLNSRNRLNGGNRAPQKQVIQRRHSSFMSMLGSMRKNKKANSTTVANTSNTLLRKMSRIIRRTKSENNMSLPTNHQNNNIRSNGITR
jgi:ankyrin repeat protein